MLQADTQLECSIQLGSGRHSERRTQYCRTGIEQTSRLWTSTASPGKGICVEGLCELSEVSLLVLDEP